MSLFLTMLLQNHSDPRSTYYQGRQRDPQEARLEAGMTPHDMLRRVIAICGEITPEDKRAANFFKRQAKLLETVDDMLITDRKKIRANISSKTRRSMVTAPELLEDTLCEFIGNPLFDLRQDETLRVVMFWLYAECIAVYNLTFNQQIPYNNNNN